MRSKRVLLLGLPAGSLLSAATVFMTTKASAVDYATAPFFQGDTRYYSGDGDWSPGDYKAECAQKLNGISATPSNVSSALRGHAALCETSTDTLNRGAASQHGGDHALADRAPAELSGTPDEQLAV